MRTALAWKNLTSSFSKCLLAGSGVGFAVILMFTQIGFSDALINSNTQVFSLFDPQIANVAIVSRARYNISTEQRFRRQTLEQALAMPEVVGHCTVSMERGTAKVKVVGSASRPIRVLAIESTHPEFLKDQQLAADLREADAHDAALLDRKTKAVYGFAKDAQELQEQSVELNGSQIKLHGQFQLGTDFSSDGTLLMSQRLHSRYFPFRSPTRNPADMVDIAILHVDLDSPAELESFARRVEALAPSQIDVRPTGDFISREQKFWATATPIGNIFMIGTVMGLVVGAIICYQIQFTDISDHMPEFATLKAMGYGARYFWSIILCQSFYLACLGFIPGLVVSYALFQVLANFSGLAMELSLFRICQVWLLTILMCFISGSLAIRKLFRSDPASLF